MAKRPRSHRPGVSAAKQASSPRPSPKPTRDYIVQHEQVRRAFDLLRDETSPCWQMTFLTIYDGWDVEIQRFVGQFIDGKRKPTDYYWLAIDEGGNCLDSAGVHYTTPEAAWNAAVTEITLFLHRQMVMPASAGGSFYPDVQWILRVLSSKP